MKFERQDKRMTLGPYTEFGLALLIVKPSDVRNMLSNVKHFYDEDGNLTEELKGAVVNVFREMYLAGFNDADRGESIAEAILADEKLTNMLFAAWRQLPAVFALHPIWIYSDEE